MADHEKLIEDFKEKIKLEKKILDEITRLNNSYEKTSDKEDKEMISSQIKFLKNSLIKENENNSRILKGIYVTKPLPKTIPYVAPQTQNSKIDTKKEMPRPKLEKPRDLELEELEKFTIKRLKKKEKIVVKTKEKKPIKYAQFANDLFYSYSKDKIENGNFKSLERDLVKASLPYTPNTYVSMIFFTTLLSLLAAMMISAFFLFFNFGVELPIITRSTESILTRLPKIAWIPIFLPVTTFFLMYIYPSLEKKSAETKIDFELPFATINMSAISGSLIDPSKIFQIIITTNEYPNLAKEFTKIINEINLQGYNFVNALRNAAFNSPSKKLSELFGGLATTINSGGDLPNFFEERSKSLLFEHRLEREKQSKAAETFMDIYISVVIAAPMILMLLLMMMRISGLGISLPVSTITLIMVLGVTVINVVFLTFLHLRKTE